MKYTITVPDEKKEFFLELINSLGIAKIEDDSAVKKDAEIPQWQIDIVEQRMNSSSKNTRHNWDDVKDEFRLD